MLKLIDHPVAATFPLMTGKEFAELKADIKKNGQLHKILVVENQIIDGRNRYRACQELGIPPLVEQWRGKGSLTEISCALNVHRRHLTKSQRAAAGAIAEEQFAREIAENRAGGNIASATPAMTKEQLKTRVLFLIHRAFKCDGMVECNFCRSLHRTNGALKAHLKRKHLDDISKLVID